MMLISPALLPVVMLTVPEPAAFAAPIGCLEDGGLEQEAVVMQKFR
jgi:hypothetical protein